MIVTTYINLSFDRFFRYNFSQEKRAMQKLPISTFFCNYTTSFLLKIMVSINNKTSSPVRVSPLKPYFFYKNEADAECSETKKDLLCLQYILVYILIFIYHILQISLRESAKKILLLMAGPLRGGGVKGPAIKEKRTFFGILQSGPVHEYYMLPIFMNNYRSRCNTGHLIMRSSFTSYSFRQQMVGLEN